jgi:aminoglycoside phosphotransferase (APT) family kinase protein
MANSKAANHPALGDPWTDIAEELVRQIFEESTLVKINDSAHWLPPALSRLQARLESSAGSELTAQLSKLRWRLDCVGADIKKRLESGEETAYDDSIGLQHLILLVESLEEAWLSLCNKFKVGLPGRTVLRGARLPAVG